MGGEKGGYGANACHKTREIITRMKLEDSLREVLRGKQYSRKTEENYVGWYRRYVLWHKEWAGRAIHPAGMGAAEVTAFLTNLAVSQRLAKIRH